MLQISRDTQADNVRWLQENALKKPGAKLGWLSRKRLNSRCVVVMAGDGVNDAPVSTNAVQFLMELTVMQALAADDVAIAIGSGSDGTLECLIRPTSHVSISRDVQRDN
jgi:high-affinity K+ transport system ATPase subunit B